MITGCSILSKFVWWKHHDKGKTIHVSQKAVLTGFMESSCHIDEENIFSLDRALKCACTSSSHFILTFDGLSFGVHSYGTSFVVQLVPAS